MKKLFGEGGIMGFLSRHCEKMVFGLAVLIVIWVALPDGERSPINESQKGPTVLSQKASDATKHLGKSSWQAIYEERYPTPDRYLKDSRNDLRRVLVSGYPAPVPLNKPNFPQDRLRQDPYIAPIEDLAVSVDYGAVAMNDPDARAGTGRGAGGLLDDDEVRPFPPDVLEFIQQFGSMPGAGAKLEGRFIVSVTGKFPIKKHRDAFAATFNETAGYSEQRDTIPVYGAFEGKEEGTYGRDFFLIERAEVLPDGSFGEFQSGWGRLERYKLGARTAKYVQGQWAGAGGGGGGGAIRGGAAQPAGSNFPDPKFVDPRFAMNVPPLLLRDLAPLANHSGIPTAAQVLEKAAAEPDVGNGLDGLDVPRADGAAPAPGAAPIRRPVRGVDGGVGGAMVDEEIDYLLFRYYDMDAEPGKSYVYRVKILMEDPNFPMDPAQRPETRTLAPEVIERLGRREKQDIWWRESEYSKDLPIARVPDPRKLLAGPVDSGKVARPPQRSFEIRQSEKGVKLMTVVWDDKRALDVPGVLDASRGSVANFTADVEAIDPAASGLRELMAYEFKTNNIVLDIRGGEWFSTKKDQSIPGEILLMDDKGNLIVHSELEDAEAYGNHIYPAAPEVMDVPLPGAVPPDPRRPPRGGGEPDIFGG